MIHKICSIFIILMVMLSMVSPVIAVESISIKDGSTTLEKRALSTVDVDIKTLTATASGVSKVKSEDITLKTSSVETGLKIEAVAETQAQKQVTHSIAIPVEDIKGFNGYVVRVTHFNDAGIKDDEYLQEVSVKDGYVILADVEFSSVIVSGFTGSKSETSYNVNVTDTSFTVTENASLLTITMGDVDDGVEIDENDSSTYPHNASFIYSFPYIYNYTDVSSTIPDLMNGDITWKNTSRGFKPLVNSTSYMYVSDSSLDVNYTDFTFSGWYYTNVTNDTVVLCSKRNAWNSVNGYSVFFATNNILYFEYGDGNSYAQISSPILSVPNTWTHIAVTFSDGTIKFYKNGEYISSHYSLTYIGSNALPYHVGSYYIDADADTTFGDSIVYPYTLSDANIKFLATGYSGTSAKLGENGEWHPVINGQVQFDNVVAGQEITFLSPEITTADSLTILYEFTEDVTLIEESETENNVIVEINQTSQHNATEGSIEYEIASLNFTYLPVMDSTNENASVSIHNQTLTIDTGPLTSGDTFLYNISLSKIVDFTYEMLYTSQYTFTMSNNSAPDYVFTIIANDLTEGHTYNLLNDTGTVLDTNSTIVDGSTTFYSALPDGDYIIQDATAGTSPSASSISGVSGSSASSGSTSIQTNVNTTTSTDVYYLWSAVLIIGFLFFWSGITNKNPIFQPVFSVIVGICIMATAANTLNILPEQIKEIVQYILGYINNAA